MSDEKIMKITRAEYDEIEEQVSLKLNQLVSLSEVMFPLMDTDEETDRGQRTNLTDLMTDTLVQVRNTLDDVLSRIAFNNRGGSSQWLNSINALNLLCVNCI